MKPLILLSFVLLVYSAYAYSDEAFVVGLPAEDVFKMRLSEACKSKPSLTGCNEIKRIDPNVTLYCRASKFDCKDVEKRLILGEYIAEKRSFNSSCIALIGNKIIVKGGKLSRYASYRLKQGCKK